MPTGPCCALPDRRGKLCLVLDLDHTLLNSVRYSEIDQRLGEMLERRSAAEAEAVLEQERLLFRMDEIKVAGCRCCSLCLLGAVLWVVLARAAAKRTAAGGGVLHHPSHRPADVDQAAAWRAALPGHCGRELRAVDPHQRCVAPSSSQLGAGPNCPPAVLRNWQHGSAGQDWHHLIQPRPCRQQVVCGSGDAAAGPQRPALWGPRDRAGR